MSDVYLYIFDAIQYNSSFFRYLYLIFLEISYFYEKKIRIFFLLGKVRFYIFYEHRNGVFVLTATWLEVKGDVAKENIILQVF